MELVYEFDEETGLFLEQVERRYSSFPGYSVPDVVILLIITRYNIASIILSNLGLQTDIAIKHIFSTPTDVLIASQDRTTVTIDDIVNQAVEEAKINNSPVVGLRHVLLSAIYFKTTLGDFITNDSNILVDDIRNYTFDNTSNTNLISKEREQAVSFFRMVNNKQKSSELSKLSELLLAVIHHIPEEIKPVFLEMKDWCDVTAVDPERGNKIKKDLIERYPWLCKDPS